MYHVPKMCRTCLQMSRGDFKFVSLDSVDPLWETNSPNLKAQLMSLVPEMKIDDANTFICTSCFISLRTAFEFKRMCQATEKKFQNHNYKYRRPFGVGPGSPQFHVTLNENRTFPHISPANTNNNNIYNSQKLNYLQADTSIDITEHHLYDASRNIPRRIQYINNNNVTPKLPEVNNVVNKKPLPNNNSNNNNNTEQKKSLNSQQLKEKFNLGSQISILQTPKSKHDVKVNHIDMDLIKRACEEIPYLKENNLGPDALWCRIRIEALTHIYVRNHTANKYSLDDIKSVSHSYYFNKLAEPLECQYCMKTFIKRNLFQMHIFEEHTDKIAKEAAVTPSIPEEKTAAKEEVKEEKPTTTPLPALEESAKTTTRQQQRRRRRRCKKLISIRNLIVKYRLRRYNKCYVCRRLCVSRLHILQHLKYRHGPRGVMRSLKSLKNIVRSKNTPHVVRKLRARIGHPFASSFRCTICDKGFVNQSELDVHMYVHTPVILSTDDPNDPKDEDSERQFKCYLCGKSFLKERFLKLHNIQMHLRNKPTTCKNCLRVFKSEFWYERHRCTLPQEEPTPDEVPDDTNMFQCSFCERKFSQLRFMKVHRRRAHKLLMANRDPKDKSSAESPILEGTKDVDPMELYSIAGTSSFSEEAAEAEAESEAEAFTDSEDPVDPAVEEDVTKHAVVPTNSTETAVKRTVPTATIRTESEQLPQPEIAPEPAPRRGRPPIIRDIKPLSEVPESEPGPGRRGNRGLPKIQCDFCGELFEENRYDKHIAEHNKSRLQRRVSTTATHIEEYDSDDFPLKCPVCYKGFKRKYYYNTHINKHIEEGIDVQEEPASPPNENPPTPTPSQPQTESRAASDDEFDESYTSEPEGSLLEEDDIQGQEIILEDNSRLYVCCGRSFKLKAHFFRHYKIKHPNNANKKDPIKYVDPSSNNVKPDVPVPPEIELLEVASVVPPSTTDVKKIQNLPELTIIQNVPEVKKINKSVIDVKKIESEPITITKTEPNIIPNDLEICLKEDVDSGNKIKRKSHENEHEGTKKLKTENAEAVKLRNTVAAHLDDIEIVAVSPTPSLKYDCPQCDKKFKQKSQLRDHKNVHTGEKPYVCEFCQPPHGFTQSSSLYFHIRKVHTGVMKNVSWAIQAKSGLCLVCLEVFERHMTMYSHLRENYVENGFDCEMCSKNVTMSCHYKSHNIDPNDMDSFMLPQHNLEVLLTEDSASRASSCTSNIEEPDDNLNEADIIMSKARRCEPCGKMFKSEQYYNMHARGLVHKQNAELYVKRGEQVEQVEEETAAAPTETIDSTDVIDNSSETQVDNDIENAEAKQEIENNCKEITKKIQRIGTFKCPMCELLFITKTHLRKHKRTKHHTTYAMHARRRRKPLLNVTAEETDVSQEEMGSEVNSSNTFYDTEDITNDSRDDDTPTFNDKSTNEDVETVQSNSVEDVEMQDSKQPVAHNEVMDTDTTEPSGVEVKAQNEKILDRLEDEEMPLLELVEDQNSTESSEDQTNCTTIVNIQDVVVQEQKERSPVNDVDDNVKIDTKNAETILKDVKTDENKKDETLDCTDLKHGTADNLKNNVTTPQKIKDDHTATTISQAADVKSDNLKNHTVKVQRTEKIQAKLECPPLVLFEKPLLKNSFSKVGSEPISKQPVTNFSSEMLAVSSHGGSSSTSLGLIQPMITPPVTQHVYPNEPQPFIDNRRNMHLSPKYYSSEQCIPRPVHYSPIMERRLSQNYLQDYSTNYFPPLQPLHSTYMQHPPRESPQNNRYGPLFDQGFVIQEDDDIIDKDLSSSDVDPNPEQELLALLHNSNNSMYELKKCDAAFDSEQEFIDLESAGAKILKQTFEKINNKSEDIGGVSSITADSSKPDSHDLYGQNLMITKNENQKDFQGGGGLPISNTVLNEMTHSFS